MRGLGPFVLCLDRPITDSLSLRVWDSLAPNYEPSCIPTNPLRPIVPFPTPKKNNLPCQRRDTRKRRGVAKSNDAVSRLCARVSPGSKNTEFARFWQIHWRKIIIKRRHQRDLMRDRGEIILQTRIKIRIRIYLIFARIFFPPIV